MPYPLVECPINPVSWRPCLRTGQIYEWGILGCCGGDTPSLAKHRTSHPDITRLVCLQSFVLPCNIRSSGSRKNPPLQSQWPGIPSPIPEEPYWRTPSAREEGRKRKDAKKDKTKRTVSTSKDLSILLLWSPPGNPVLCPYIPYRPPDPLWMYCSTSSLPFWNPPTGSTMPSPCSQHFSLPTPLPPAAISTAFHSRRIYPLRDVQFPALSITRPAPPAFVGVPLPV